MEIFRRGHRSAATNIPFPRSSLFVANCARLIKMRSIKSVLLFILLVAAICRAQDDTGKFKYREIGGLPVGTVLHYVKTNIDGTRPEYISQYIAATDVMESFKFHPKSPPAGFVVVEMDWRTFSARSLKSWRVLSRDDSRKLFATLIFDNASRKSEVSIPAIRKEKDIFDFKRLPLHVYNFDLGTLNFAISHLVSPKKPFVVGIADPTFKAEGPLMEYKGEVTITFAGEENRNNAATRKHKIDGPGLQNRGGFIWVNKKQNWIEDVEIDLPDNPDWTSFKFTLLKTEKMDRKQWEKFMADQL